MNLADRLYAERHWRPCAARGAFPFENHRTVAQVWGLPAADRTPCPRCGVRADLGCAHSARVA